jgi:hypothetical protein
LQKTASQITNTAQNYSYFATHQHRRAARFLSDGRGSNLASHPLSSARTQSEKKKKSSASI